MKNSNFFAEKIDCIYKNIANGNLISLAKLFLSEDKHNIEHHITNRKTHISRSWLKQKNSNFTPRTFKTEYKDYSFFKEIRVDSKPLFKDAYEFLELPLEEFCKRVYSYINYKNSLYIDDKNFIFHYLYIHKTTYDNKETNSIQEYQIVYNKKLSANSIEITVFPTKEENSDEIYKGVATYKNSKLILQFENSWNYITVIANLEFIHNRTYYLIGILSAFSELNKKVPGAKKVILTRDKAYDYNRQYFTLNETELLFAEENTYKFHLSNFDYVSNHFNKYLTKLNALDTLFSNLVRNGYFTDSYYQLAFRELHILNIIFNNVKNGSSYYVKNRYNILKAVFTSFKYKKYNNFCMVIPLSNNYSPFNHFSNESEYIINSLKYLKDNGVIIEIIFIIDNCSNGFTIEFKEHLKSLTSIANIYFLQKEEVENRVDSLDFLFVESSNIVDFIIYKPLNSYQQIFVFSKEVHAIKQFESSYKKIKLYAKQLKLPLKIEDYCTYVTNHIKALVGDWYLYLYGSKQLWELNVKIYNNNFVEFFHKGNLSYQGELINRDYQSIILAEDVKTKRITTYMFDNNVFDLRDIFLVKAIAKQYQKNGDIFTIGIFSKDAIDLEDVKYILGEKDKQTLMLDEAIKARLSDYIFDKYE